MTVSGAVGAAPHVHEGTSTARMMWMVVLCLVPAGAWGVWAFGLRALLVLAISVVAALVGEAIANLIMRRFTLDDGSALLSGLLVAYMLPPGVPLYVPAAASLFAMLVIKASFGGLGSNWMNPAVGGQVFAYFSWSGAFAVWTVPRMWSGAAMHGASTPLPPLQFLAQSAGSSGTIGSHAVPALLHAYPVSSAAGAVSNWLSSALQLGIDPHYVDLLLGNVPGTIGAVPVVLLVLGSVYLFVRRIITWHAPAGFLASFLLLIWIFGGLPHRAGWFGGLPLLHLLTGGTVLAALFLCTDPVTSPLSGRGMVAYGAGIGILAFLIRIFGAAEEAVFMAILLMNILVPTINRMMEKRRNGTSG